MSFTCQHCNRIVVDNRRKANKCKPTVVQLSPRPNRVVVKRRRDGQIAREEDWCNQCTQCQESCDVCLESFPFRDDIVHCDCGQNVCVFCWDEHAKDCKEQE